MKKYLFTVIIGLTLLFCTSCSVLHMHTVVANQQFRTGRYQDALRLYLTRLPGGAVGDYFVYNIGNVYYFLGEEERAEEYWNRVLDSPFREVRSGAAFNSGVAQFNRGEYGKAFSSFQSALKEDPSGRDIKINLEYAYRNMKNVQVPATVPGKREMEASAAAAEKKAEESLLELINEESDNLLFSGGSRESFGEYPEDW